MISSDTKIGDALYIKGRIGWKGLKKEEYLDNGNYRIINAESLIDGHIDWNKAGYISEERYAESPEIMLKEGDILISKDGTIGKVGFVKELTQPTSVASGIFVVRNTDPEHYDTRFIYHYLRSPMFSDFIKTRTEGSVIPHLYQSDFVCLPFPEMELSDQRKISTLLDLFENKILVNNKINDYLFEILRAKYLELISSECVVKTLDEISDIESGKRPSFIADSQSDDARIPVIGAAKIMGYTSDSMYSERMLVTGRVGTHGVIQRYWKEIWPSDNTLTIKTDHYEFVYQVLKDIDYSAINRGSTQPLITQSDLKNTEIWWPKSSKLEEYGDFVKPITTIIEKNIEQSVKLAAMRDVLLPKLMSGEIDVSKLELNS